MPLRRISRLKPKPTSYPNPNEWRAAVTTEEPTRGCLLWRGAQDGKGYGMFKDSLGKKFLAHRVSLGLELGRALTTEECALHKCDVRACINPDHLFVGTRQDNTMDMVSKNRNAKGTRVNTAKLNPAKVLAIRALHASGYATDILAAQFGVHRKTINRLVRGKTWRSV